MSRDVLLRIAPSAFLIIVWSNEHESIRISRGQFIASFVFNRDSILRARVSLTFWYKKWSAAEQTAPAKNDRMLSREEVMVFVVVCVCVCVLGLQSVGV